MSADYVQGLIIGGLCVATWVLVRRAWRRT